MNHPLDLNVQSLGLQPAEEGVRLGPCRSLAGFLLALIMRELPELFLTRKHGRVPCQRDHQVKGFCFAVGCPLHRVDEGSRAFEGEVSRAKSGFYPTPSKVCD